MSDKFSRTEMLLGTENMKKLKTAHVAVFGLGGVGGHIVEALARSGIGELTLIDADTIAKSNLNRQIIATYETLNMNKTDAMKNRILSINPDIKVHTRELFYLPENADNLPLEAYNYVADAIDTVSAKIELAVRCEKLGIPLISSMGTVNKLDPTALTVTDIYKTSGCPLARVMRHELKNRGVKALKVVYSEEKPIKPIFTQDSPSKKSPPGSCAFVPSVAGLIIASEIIKDLCK